MNIPSILDNIDTSHSNLQKEKAEKLAQDIKNLQECLGPDIEAQLQSEISKAFTAHTTEQTSKSIRVLNSGERYELYIKPTINIKGVDLKKLKSYSNFNKAYSIDFYMSNLIMNNILSQYKDDITVTNISVKGFYNMIDETNPIDMILMTITVLPIPLLIYMKLEHYLTMKRGTIPVNISIKFVRKTPYTKDIVPRIDQPDVVSMWG